MVMTKIEKYKSLYKYKKTECLVRKEAYDIWLGFLTPLKWTSIAIGVIFPAIAGATFFLKVFGDKWEIWAAVILLISAIVSGLHSLLKCDIHQEECKRLTKKYEAMADKYNDAIILEPDNMISLQDELASELRLLKKESITTPMKWCFTRAAKKFNFVEI